MAEARLVRVLPLAGLHLQGAGGRAALEPAPGAVTREEPLLPRLETLLGLLASRMLESSGAGGCSGDWWSCTAASAARLACGDGDKAEVTFTGPLLAVTLRTRRDRGREERMQLYINAGTALLAVEALHAYLDAALAAREAAETLNPRRRAELRAEAGKKLADLQRRGHLLPAETLLARWTGVALNPRRGSVEYGHLYTRPRIDYRIPLPDAVVEKAEIILVACCKTQDNSSGHLEWLAGLGPRSPPVRARLEPLQDNGICSQLHNIDTTKTRIALTPTPLSECTLSSAEQPLKLTAIHPRRPPPPLELLAASYSTSNIKGLPEAVRKTKPRPSLWPGTIILEDGGNTVEDPEERTINSLKVRLVRAPPVELVESMARQLEAQLRAS